MNIGPRIRWLRSEPTGEATLNIGFVGRHTLLQQVLMSRNPQALVVRLDFDISD